MTDADKKLRPLANGLTIAGTVKLVNCLGTGIGESFDAERAGSLPGIRRTDMEGQARGLVSHLGRAVRRARGDRVLQALGIRQGERLEAG